MQKNWMRRLKMKMPWLIISFGHIIYKNDTETSVSNTMNFTKNLALVLINTQKEYLSGDTHRCLDSYFSNTPSINKKIDLYIFFNQGEESEYSDLLKYKQHKNVNEVFVKSHRLSDFEDLYARTPKELKAMNLPKVPSLGGSSGPNNLFFNSMIPLTEKSYRE